MGLPGSVGIPAIAPPDRDQRVWHQTYLPGENSLVEQREQLERLAVPLQHDRVCVRQ